MIRSSLESRIHILHRPTPEDAIGSRKWLKAAVVLTAVTLALGALALWRWRNSPFQWRLFWSAFIDLDWRWLAGAIALLLFTYFGRVLRWEVMLRPIKPNPSLWRLTSATVIGFTAVVLLGRPGELVRPYLIAIKEGVPFSSQMAAWILERILDLLVVLLIFGYALARIPANHLPLSAGLQWTLSVGGYFVATVSTVAVLLLLAMRNFSESSERRLLSALSFLPEGAYRRTQTTLRAFVQGMQATRNHGFLSLLLFYTALEWGAIVGGYYLLFQAFPSTAHLNLTAVVIFVGFVSFGSIVQIPGIGGGVQVASVVVLTELFGIPFEAAAGMALLIWILTFVIIVPFGLGFALHEGINWRSFRHIQEEVGL